MVKHVTRYVVDFLKDISNYNDSGLIITEVITSDAPDTIKASRYAASDGPNPYQFITDSFLPSVVNFSHVPMYAMELLYTSGGGESADCSTSSHCVYPLKHAFGLVSSKYRSLSPLLFTQMSVDHLMRTDISVPKRYVCLLCMVVYD